MPSITIKIGTRGLAVESGERVYYCSSFEGLVSILDEIIVSGGAGSYTIETPQFERQLEVVGRRA